MNKNKRYVTSVTQHSDQFLAILLGLKSILGMPISIAKPIARSKPGVTVELNPHFEINSELSTDEIKNQLDKYEIEITIINQ